jgi:hypothetical protein
LRDPVRVASEGRAAVLLEEVLALVAAWPAEGGVGVSDRLPELLDCKALMVELGVRRATAECVMRQLPIVSFPGLRKVYVKRSDVSRLVEERTFEKGQVPA